MALGASGREALPNALTFGGPESNEALKGVLEEVLDGAVHRIVFALPAGATWPLPLYELALLTGSFLMDHGTSGVELALVTPEEEPLAVFGREASEAIGELLEARGIAVHLRTTPLDFEGGVVRTAPGDGIEADRVIALPRLEGPRLAGLPCDRDGFIPTDDRCRVGSEVDVYAAGDATQFPLKQGGIATQQADTAAAEIAAQAGAPVEPEPFKPVLRGLLLTGMVPRYLRGEPGTREVDGRHRGAVVAAVQDRRPLPRAVPGRQARALGGAAASGAALATRRKAAAIRRPRSARTTSTLTRCQPGLRSGRLSVVGATTRADRVTPPVLTVVRTGAFVTKRILSRPGPRAQNALCS